MKRYVYCTKNDNGHRPLTIGKAYEILAIED